MNQVVSYDLRQYAAMPWFKFRRAVRLGMSVGFVLLIIWDVTDVYRQLVDGSGNALGFIGAGVILLILSFLLFVALMMRPPALELTIDDEKVCLEFNRGPPDVRYWKADGVTFRGRYTAGASDLISKNQPIWSLYGRLGGLSESFIPREAFDELQTRARALGFRFTEESGHPGWRLYSLRTP
jgi:hypothetical protein